MIVMEVSVYDDLELEIGDDVDIQVSRWWWVTTWEQGDLTHEGIYVSEGLPSINDVVPDFVEWVEQGCRSIDKSTGDSVTLPDRVMAKLRTEALVQRAGLG